MQQQLVTDELAETRVVLIDLARRRFGALRPERVVEHVLAVTKEGDLALRRAALDALARRYGFAERDELKVAVRPGGRALFGTYGTASKRKAGRASSRPYKTALLSLAPLRTSCSCADFVRSSLGLCKHGLVVLEALEKSGALARFKGESPGRPRRAVLAWSAEHPLQGPADRLARLVYVHAGRGAEPSGFKRGRPSERALSLAGSRLTLIAELERKISRGQLDVEPAVTTLLAEERARAERRIESEAHVRGAMKSLSGLKRKLYPYQREGVKRFFELGRLLLADDMGLGKTTQAIAACHGLFEAGRVRHGLLIVPAALKPQWKREWEATTRVPVMLVEGSPSERARLYRSKKPGFLVLGYEQLLRDFAHVQTFAPEMVVLDEAQRIKNWATKSAAYVKALSPRYRLVLTGTPMENRLAELASIMDFVDDVALEPKWRLVPFHTIADGNAGRGVGGARNLDVLRERLSAGMLRRVRKDVLSQLPARIDTRVPVEMTEPQRNEHEELRRPIAELVRKAAARPLKPAEFLQLMALLTKQRVICNGLGQLYFEADWPRIMNGPPAPETLAGLFAPKLATLRGLIEQAVIAQGRKAVVFSQWRNMLRLAEWATRDLLREAGMRAVFFTGAESAKLRERAIVELHDDPAASVMFLSDAGGVGLNLQRAASVCINLELPWNPAVLEQRIGRIYRLGQKQPIDVYNLVTEEGIEANIAKLVGQKSAVFSSLFDGTSNEVVFDGQTSFMEGVQKLVEPVLIPESASEDTVESELGITGEEDVLPVTPVPEPAVIEPPPLDGLGLSVARLADGGLRIEAPAALAAPLAELFEALAHSLRGSLPGLDGGSAPSAQAFRPLALR